MLIDLLERTNQRWLSVQSTLLCLLQSSLISVLLPVETYKSTLICVQLPVDAYTSTFIFMQLVLHISHPNGISINVALSASLPKLVMQLGEQTGQGVNAIQYHSRSILAKVVGERVRWRKTGIIRGTKLKKRYSVYSSMIVVVRVTRKTWPLLLRCFATTIYSTPSKRSKETHDDQHLLQHKLSEPRTACCRPSTPKVRLLFRIPWANRWCGKPTSFYY